MNELIARNASFGALLFSDIGHKLSVLAQQPGQHERQSLTMARVDRPICASTYGELRLRTSSRW